MFERGNYGKKKGFALMLAALMLCAGCGAAQGADNASAEASVDTEAASAYTMDASSVDESKEYGVAADAAAGSSADGGEAGTLAAADVESAAPESAKMIYTYNYSVETRQFDDFMSMVAGRVEEYGGYIESSETNGNAEMDVRRFANLVIRVPSANMHGFLDMVAENSNVTRSSTSGEDVTLSYVDMQSHIKALRTEQETLMGLLEKAEKIEDIISIQGQLTTVRYELESYESQMRVLDNRIDYSTLYLDVNEVERESNVADKLSYGEEIAKGLSDTFYNLGRSLRGFSIWFIVKLPVILICLAAFLALFFIVRAILRKMRRRPRRAKESGRPASGGNAKEGGRAAAGENASDAKNDAPGPQDVK